MEWNMFNHVRCLTFIYGLTLLAGCTSDHIVGRYKTAKCSTDKSAEVDCNTQIPTAAVSAVSIKTPASSSPTSGTTFPERALAAYINVLANPKLSSSAKELRTNLAQPLKAEESASVDDRTVFHRTIIVSVRKTGDFNPADRLEGTEVTIQTTNARFDSWDTLATAYTTVNAGTVQLTQARGLTENLSVGTPATAPLAATGTIGGSQTDTRVENFTATTQAETLSATVEDGGKSLVIHRQGGIGIDLTGNTIIKVDMSYAGGPLSTYMFSVAAYIDDKKKPIPPSKLSVKVSPVITLPPGTEIDAGIGLRYTARHVVSGDATYEEDDDEVLEKTMSAPTQPKVVLVPTREAAPPGFGFFATAGIFEGFALDASRPGHAPVAVCFDNYNDASEFLAYLKANNSGNPSRVGKVALGFVEPPEQIVVPLSLATLQLLEVQPRCF